MNLEYKEGLRLISSQYTVGYIQQIKKFHPNGEPHIIIEWKDFGKVQYTKAMLDESFSMERIQIDKQYYRDKKLNELGI